MTQARHLLVRAADQASLKETAFSHPLNPRSEVHMRSLGDAVGLERVGFHVFRVPPGKESFAYHAHYTEEEFLFVLAGRGIVEMAGEKYEIAPGDFMGFPTPSVAHQLYNPFEEDLVYLAGGERRPAEVADFPKSGKRLVRVGMSFSFHTIDDAEGFGPLPKVRVE
jgi:uncharacterized cupin superfamily protein